MTDLDELWNNYQRTMDDAKRRAYWDGWLLGFFLGALFISVVAFLALVTKP